MRLPNIFDFINANEVTPQFSPTLFKFDDENRPLTSNEVRQCKQNQNIIYFGLIEAGLDINRLEKVINRIYETYPLLNNKIVFDEKLQWLRYETQPLSPFKFPKSFETVTSLD